jgi:hypothetical protein
MARRSLRPHLNQIRTWVRQGRTDAWIAHQLEVTVQQIDVFKHENDLSPESEAPNGAASADFDDEVDLRAEDDALIAAELEAEAEAAALEPDEDDSDDADDDDADDGEPAPRRRGRRGGRGRRPRGRAGAALEGTFDHGDEGYGLWLDPAIADSAIYAEHWAGHRPVEVTIEEDRIIIRRAGPDAESDDDAEPDAPSEATDDAEE